VIEFDGVAHRFGDRPVLQEITLALGEHRIGIIGANGSGKSTLIRMINGLVVPEQGRVLVHGRDTATQGREVRRLVSFLFSDPDAQIVMPTVQEDVAFSLRRHRISGDERARRVSAALELVGIAGLAEQPAHALSSGQKQLLAAAAILVTEPSILVCDEPTTLLDLSNARRLMRLIDDLPQQVVLVTHDLSIVQDWERVIVLDGGRIVSDGPGADSVAAYLRLHGQQ